MTKKNWNRSNVLEPDIEILKNVRSKSNIKIPNSIQLKEKYNEVIEYFQANSPRQSSTVKMFRKRIKLFQI